MKSSWILFTIMIMQFVYFLKCTSRLKIYLYIFQILISWCFGELPWLDFCCRASLPTCHSSDSSRWNHRSWPSTFQRRAGWTAAQCRSSDASFSGRHTAPALSRRSPEAWKLNISFIHLLLWEIMKAVTVKLTNSINNNQRQLF